MVVKGWKDTLSLFMIVCYSGRSFDILCIMTESFECASKRLNDTELAISSHSFGFVSALYRDAFQLAKFLSNMHAPVGRGRRRINMCLVSVSIKTA